MKKLEKLKNVGRLSKQSNNQTRTSSKVIVNGPVNPIDRIYRTQPFGTVTKENTGWILNSDFNAYPDIGYGDSFNTQWFFE